jgi:hypothetical protein
MSVAMETQPRAGLASTGEATSESVAEPELEWSYNPWRERGTRSAVAALALLAICLMLSRLGESAVLTLSLCLAAAGALAPLLTPSRCRMDDEGIACRGALGWERRRWAELRRASVTAGGVLCSPYAAAHWLDSHRGLFLPVPREQRTALLAEIRPRLARHGL